MGPLSEPTTWTLLYYSQMKGNKERTEICGIVRSSEENLVKLENNPRFSLFQYLWGKQKCMGILIFVLVSACLRLYFLFFFFLERLYFHEGNEKKKAKPKISLLPLKKIVLIIICPQMRKVLKPSRKSKYSLELKIYAFGSC